MGLIFRKPTVNIGARYSAIECAPGGFSDVGLRTVSFSRRTIDVFGFDKYVLKVDVLYLTR